MTDPRILTAIPHREPFLLIDQIVALDPQRIVCSKTFRGDEFWFRGHYPDFPLVPGVLLCEAAMQAGAVLLSQQLSAPSDQVPVVTRINDVRFKQMVRPGETIEMDVTLDQQLANAFFLTARVTRGKQLAVRFQFACTLTRGKEEDEQDRSDRSDRSDRPD